MAWFGQTRDPGRRGRHSHLATPFHRGTRHSLVNAGSPALPAQEPPPPDPGFLPPPSSPELLLRPRLCSPERLRPYVLRAHRRSVTPAPSPPARARGTPCRERNALAGLFPPQNTLCQQQYLWALLYKPAPQTAPAQHPPRGAPAPSDTRGSRRNGRPHPAAPGRAQEGTTDAIPRRGLPAWQGMLPLEHHAVKKYQLKKWEIALGGAV